MENADYSAMHEYCQISNYCYMCFMIDPQDPEILCNGLCYQCHGSKWDKMKHVLPLEKIEQTLNKLPRDSRWFTLYQQEYNARISK